MARLEGWGQNNKHVLFITSAIVGIGILISMLAATCVYTILDGRGREERDDKQRQAERNACEELRRRDDKNDRKCERMEDAHRREIDRRDYFDQCRWQGELIINASSEKTEPLLKFIEVSTKDEAAPKRGAV